jgi:hypothetical protein
VIALLLLILAASQNAESTVEPPPQLSAEEKKRVMRALGITDAHVERAKRAMGYAYCLYGTSELSKFSGLRIKKAERTAFLHNRRADCTDERSISEQAFVEQLSVDPSLSDSERISKAKQILDGVNLTFEENVLRPEVAEARKKAFMECIRTKGAYNCF